MFGTTDGYFGSGYGGHDLSADGWGSGSYLFFDEGYGSGYGAGASDGHGYSFVCYGSHFQGAGSGTAAYYRPQSFSFDVRIHLMRPGSPESFWLYALWEEARK